jgi:hypothetical protein
MEAARPLARVCSRGDNRLLSRVISTYAFPTYGPRGMDSRAVRRKSFWVIFEGIEPDDVTGRFYSADPAINRKCEIMEKWIARLEHRCAEAIRKDGLLTDSKPLGDEFSNPATLTSAGRKKHRRTYITLIGRRPLCANSGRYGSARRTLSQLPGCTSVALGNSAGKERKNQTKMARPKRIERPPLRIMANAGALVPRRSRRSHKLLFFCYCRRGCKSARGPNL